MTHTPPNPVFDHLRAPRPNRPLVLSRRRADALALQMGQCLDEERRRQGMTQLALARTLTSSKARATKTIEKPRGAINTVSSVLDGRTSRTSTLARMAAALDCQWVVQLVPSEDTDDRDE